MNPEEVQVEQSQETADKQSVQSNSNNENNSPNPPPPFEDNRPETAAVAELQNNINTNPTTEDSSDEVTAEPVVISSEITDVTTPTASVDRQTWLTLSAQEIVETKLQLNWEEIYARFRVANSGRSSTQINTWIKHLAIYTEHNIATETPKISEMGIVINDGSDGSSPIFLASSIDVAFNLARQIKMPKGATFIQRYPWGKERTVGYEFATPDTWANIQAHRDSLFNLEELIDKLENITGNSAEANGARRFTLPGDEFTSLVRSAQEKMGVAPTGICTEETLGQITAYQEQQRQAEAQKAEEAQAQQEEAAKQAAAEIDIDQSYESILEKLITATGFRYTTMAADLELKIGIGAYASAMWGLARTEIKAVFGAKCGINVQDDRQCRVYGQLSLGAEAKGSALWGLVEGKIGAEGIIRLTGVYKSFEDFVAHFVAELYELGKILREAQGGNNDNLPERSDEFLARSQSSVGTVSSRETHLYSSVKVGDDNNSVEIGSDITSTTNEFLDEEGNVRGTGTSSAESVYVDINAGGNHIGKLEITGSKIANDYNPNNDGEYMNVKFTVNTPLRESEQEETQKVIASVIKSNNELPYIELLNVLKGQLENLVGKKFGLNITSKAISTSNILELNFVKSGESYYLQYAKSHIGASYDFSTEKSVVLASNGAVDAGGVGSVDFSASAEVNVNEALSDSTTSYVETVYNGLRNATGGGQEAWSDFAHNHRSELIDMISNIAIENSNVRTEIEGNLAYALGEIQTGRMTSVSEGDLAIKQRLIDLAKEHPINESALLRAFETYLDICHEIWKHKRANYN